MPACPDYRLRLFMSVDLVGSTAFKARFGETREENGHPIWVNQIRHFYREFPEFTTQRYGRTLTAAGESYIIYESLRPSVWKTIGDEILFCCRVKSVEHLACCVRAFLGALDDYGQYLDAEDIGLDVKGSGWLAAFPAPNISVEVSTSPEGERDQIDEEFEARADLDPSEFDFLGKGIDSGFRAAKYAAADRFTPSAELAWLLCDAAHQNAFPHNFLYHGRDILKGVIENHPYPITSIDCERSLTRRELKEHERTITGETHASAMHLRDFLRAFMIQEGIELPMLPRHPTVAIAGEMPKSYKDFKIAWDAVAQENTKRSQTEVESGRPDAGNVAGELPASLDAALDAAVALTEGTAPAGG
jgi:hypothetical protein